MHAAFVRSARAVVLASLSGATLLACRGEATGALSAGPRSVAEILAERARWVAHAPRHYSYVGLSSCTFCAFNNIPLRLEVRDDTVRSVTFVHTGQAVPGSYVFYPSITALFGLALVRLGEGKLIDIAFDAQWAYPARMDFDGADISGSLTASDLRVLP